MRANGPGVRLGWRWFSRATGSGRRLRRDRVLASGVAVFVGLLSMTLWQANSSREQRALAQEPHPAPSSGATFRAFEVDAPSGDDVWSTVYVASAGQGAPPTPPGLTTFPESGQTWVSPAVERLVHENPSAASRIPGRIVGTIGTAGLQSPDQLFVYAGARARPTWWSADGWGSRAASVARPSIPRLPFLGLVAILLGLPVALLVRTTARVSADSRGRSLAAAHLMGVPARTLAVASAVDAACCTLLGSLAGVVAMVVGVAAAHRQTWLGIAWFTPVTMVSPAAAVAVSVVVIAAVASLSWRVTSTDLDNVLLARAGEPRPGRWWRVAPLAIGVAALAGVVVPEYLIGHRTPPVLCLWYLFVGGALATTGAFLGLAQVLRWCARRWQARAQTPVGRLAARRLWWESDTIATSCAALLVMGVSAMTGAGAIADLDAISPVSRAGDTYQFQTSDAGSLEKALSVPGLRILQVTRRSRTLDIADCPTLARVVAITAPDLSDEFSAQCRTGRTFRLAGAGRPSPRRIVLPGLQHSVLLGVRTLAEDPRGQVPGTGNVSILAWPGADQHEVDRYVTGILAAAPLTQVTDLSADSFKPMVQPTRRLLLVCTVGGLVIATCLLVVTSLDTVGRTRSQQARLTVLGAAPSVALRSHTLAFGLGAGVALVIGLVIGSLMAGVYDIAGGLVTGPGGLGFTVALLASLATALGVAISAWAAHRDRGEPLTELLRHE